MLNHRPTCAWAVVIWMTAAYLSISIYLYLSVYICGTWVLNHRCMCAWAVVITMTAAAGGTKTVTLSRRAYGTQASIQVSVDATAVSLQTHKQTHTHSITTIHTHTHTHTWMRCLCQCAASGPAGPEARGLPSQALALLCALLTHARRVQSRALRHTCSLQRLALA